MGLRFHELVTFGNMLMIAASKFCESHEIIKNQVEELSLVSNTLKDPMTNLNVAIFKLLEFDREVIPSELSEFNRQLARPNSYFTGLMSFCKDFGRPLVDRLRTITREENEEIANMLRDKRHSMEEILKDRKDMNSLADSMSILLLHTEKLIDNSKIFQFNTNNDYFFKFTKRIFFLNSF